MTGEQALSAAPCRWAALLAVVMLTFPSPTAGDCDKAFYIWEAG